jgi:hypothetical protein
MLSELPQLLRRTVHWNIQSPFLLLLSHITYLPVVLYDVRLCLSTLREVGVSRLKVFRNWQLRITFGPRWVELTGVRRRASKLQWTMMPIPHQIKADDTERRGRAVNTPASYSGGPGSKFRPRHWLCWEFTWFSSVRLENAGIVP